MSVEVEFFWSDGSVYRQHYLTKAAAEKAIDKYNELNTITGARIVELESQKSGEE